MMSKKKSNFHVKLTKIKKISYAPTWWIKLKGKHHSRRGKGVCDEYLRKLIKKEASIESLEVINAEKALESTRKAGANALVTLSENKSRLSEVPNDSNEHSVEAIRTNRHNLNNKNLALSAIKDMLERLSQINETIVSADAVLSEHIMNLRNQTAEISHTYISGVRSGKIPDYEFLMKEYDDIPQKVYLEKHNELDSRIRNITNEYMKGEAI